MKLSRERIKSLQALLKAQTGRDYTDEETQDAGIAIVRFVATKAQRKYELMNFEENVHGKSLGSAEATAHRQRTE